MDAIPPTLPFVIARAYGTPAVAAPRTNDHRGRSFSIQDAAAARDSRDRAEFSSQPPIESPLGALRDRVDPSLIAGTVPGKVYFESTPSPTSGAYQMYKRPADKNAAATAIDVGRVVDLHG